MDRSASQRVLITGAAGKTGLALLHRLRRLDPPQVRATKVRALARSSGQRSRLERAGADEVVVGDLRDESSLAEALEQVDAIYHICPNVDPEEVSIGRRMIRLAVRSGVGRFVYHSVLAPRLRDMPHHWAKAQVEELLAASPLDFTILQPAPYMQNLVVQRASLLESGRYRVPYALDTRVSMVDLEEVAEAAARILTEPGHSKAAYELCAPELLSQVDVIRELERALGRRVRAEVLDRAEWGRSARATGMSEYQVETLLAMFRHYELRGMSGSHENLEQLLGRAPSTFARFAERVFGA